MRVTWPDGEWEYGTRRHMLEPRGGVTRQGVVLTDLESPLDCQYNFSLSLSLSLSLSGF